jgi:hypothetical protein
LAEYEYEPSEMVASDHHHDAAIQAIYDGVASDHHHDAAIQALREGLTDERYRDAAAWVVGQGARGHAFNELVRAAFRDHLAVDVSFHQAAAERGATDHAPDKRGGADDEQWITDTSPSLSAFSDRRICANGWLAAGPHQRRAIEACHRRRMKLRTSRRDSHALTWENAWRQIGSLQRATRSSPTSLS